jgi:hypothetical protein
MNIQRQISVLFLITVTAGLLIAATNLAAGPIKVNSANPNSGALGETYTVEIKGQGLFDANRVRFLVTKTSFTGNVEVSLDCPPALSEPPRCDDSTIYAKVKIPGHATVADYDIEVQLRGGRKGKGTTLFRVRKKDDLPLTWVPVSGAWDPEFGEDDASIDRNWKWDTWHEHVTLDMPRPCGSGTFAEGATSVRFSCQKGGRVHVDLAGTCDHLNHLAAFDPIVTFGPTHPNIAYDTTPNPDDGCPFEGPCFKINYASYVGQPGPHEEEVVLHPFGQVPGLPAVGRIQFRAFGEGSHIELSAFDLNPFTMPQSVEMTYIQITFYAAQKTKVVGRCETGPLEDGVLFVTAPIPD